MVVDFVNDQRQERVYLERMRRLSRCVIRRLKIKTPGRLTVAFIDDRKMRRLNKQFLSHDWPTDVLSFRYPGDETGRSGKALQEPVIGEILIAPSRAKAFSKRLSAPYTEELSRYLIHGLLHWLGYEDQTAQQQKQMRQREDRLLRSCGVKKR